MDTFAETQSLPAQAALCQSSALRELHMEKLHLLELNRQYLSALAQCEGKLVDLRGLLQLKDSEITLLRSFLTHTADTRVVKTVTQLHARNLLLEEENKQLRAILSLSADISRLQQLHSTESENPLADGIRTALDSLAAVTRERDSLKNEEIPRLQRVAKICEMERNELERRLDATRLRGVDKDTSFPDISVSDKQECASSDHKTSRKDGYIPSFLREKNRQKLGRLMTIKKVLVQAGTGHKSKDDEC